MSSDLIALVLGTVLGVGAIAFVLYPLFFGVRERIARRPARPVADDSAIRALREIEFDRATGKLSDADYTELRRTYGARALSQMREAEHRPASSEVMVPDAAIADPVEARVQAYRRAHRECATCGLRPEPDAIYCSTCGSYLDRACAACHAPVTEPGAGYCPACGEPLSAPARG